MASQTSSSSTSSSRTSAPTPSAKSSETTTKSPRASQSSTQSPSESSLPTISSYPTWTATPSANRTEIVLSAEDALAKAAKEFAESPSGISTFSVLGLLGTLTAIGVAFGIRRARQPAKRSPQEIQYQNPTIVAKAAQVPKRFSERIPVIQSTTVNKNPILETYRVKQAPQQVFKRPVGYVQPNGAKGITASNSPALNAFIAQNARIPTASVPRPLGISPIAGPNPRADLRAFQATTVRQIRSPSAQARMTIPAQGWKPK